MFNIKKRKYWNEKLTGKDSLVRRKIEARKFLSMNFLMLRLFVSKRIYRARFLFCLIWADLWWIILIFVVVFINISTINSDLLKISMWIISFECFYLAFNVFREKTESHIIKLRRSSQNRVFKLYGFDCKT